MTDLPTDWQSRSASGSGVCMQSRRPQKWNRVQNGEIQNEWQLLLWPRTNKWRTKIFLANRGVSRRDKLKREERDLCRLPKSYLMKPPTKFLVETYQFSKPVSFNVYCACFVRLYADNCRAHGRLWLPRDLRVSKYPTHKIVCFYAWR